MKYVITILLILISYFLSYGQQMPHYSQYMHNGFVLNPAIAGTDNCIQIGLDVRKQWLGFADSPFTQSFFIHSALGKKSGLGLIIFNDVAGAESMLGSELAYSYMVKKTKNESLSLGISVKVMQYVFNESSFVTNIPDDPGLTYGLVSAIQPDVAFGAYYKNKTMNYGIGIQQLLSSTLYKTSISFLERHYFLTAGYVIAQNRQVTLEPSILLKGMENTTISFDLNLKVIFQNKFILGASYRNHDGIILLLGINTGKLLIAYNYDLITSRLFKYNKGSHEIFLGYKICRNKSKKDSFGKRGVHCPAYNL